MWPPSVSPTSSSSTCSRPSSTAPTRTPGGRPNPSSSAEPDNAPSWAAAQSRWWRPGRRTVIPKTHPWAASWSLDGHRDTGSTIRTCNSGLLTMPLDPAPSSNTDSTRSSWLPLLARGTTLGLTQFWRHRTPDTFDANDLLLAEDITARAALAIDNARRYTRERTTAVASPRRPLGEFLQLARCTAVRLTCSD